MGVSCLHAGFQRLSSKFLTRPTYSENSVAASIQGAKTKLQKSKLREYLSRTNGQGRTDIMDILPIASSLSLKVAILTKSRHASSKAAVRGNCCRDGTGKNGGRSFNAIRRRELACNVGSSISTFSGHRKSLGDIFSVGHRRFVGGFAYSEIDTTSLYAEENRGNGWGNSLDVDSKDYPMVRTYENDLCRLTLIGNRNLEQAITAAAADGGVIAAEHIASGRPLMVVETIYPGTCGEHSTISTRLLVRARKVAEKAKIIQTTIASNGLLDTSSRNVLPSAFRKVVMQDIWNFELVFLNPGTRRDMADLGNPREVQVFGSVNSSDERILTGLAEALCSYAAACMKDDFYQKMHGKSSNHLLQFFQKSKCLTSSDSYVRVCSLSQPEIAAHLNSQLERNNLIKEMQKSRDFGASHNWWWPLPFCSSRLHNSCGIEFDAWTKEYVPVHKLQIDFRKFRNVKFQGGQKHPHDVWEIPLSHSQMVELADVLDMYYEDPHTCPEKQLRSRIVLETPKLAMSKITQSLWRALYASLVSGFALLSVIIAARLWKLNFVKLGAFSSSYMAMATSVQSPEGYHADQLSKYVLPQNKEVSAAEMEALCTSVVRMVRDALQWSTDIKSSTGKGAWIGENLIDWSRLEDMIQTRVVMEDGSSSIRKEVEDLDHSRGNDRLKQAVASKENIFTQDHMEDKLQGFDMRDTAIYEVVLSRNGKLLGIQPTNRIAVNRWATNPLAKALYGGRKLCPGLLEPRLKFLGPPENAVLIELLLSGNPAPPFAIARPCHI